VNARTWKAWLVPGGLLLALAATLVNSSLFVRSRPRWPSTISAVFAAGLLLAWRFNSSRFCFRCWSVAGASRRRFLFRRPCSSGPGRTAVALAALLIPLNFVVFASMRERGLIVAGIAPRFGLLFLESVVFAVLCRPENSPPPHQARARLDSVVDSVELCGRHRGLCPPFLPNPQADRAGLCVVRGRRFPVAQFAPIGKMADAYVATAALILAASLIETSYVLAYHDELTGIRGRRAFNESLLSLDQQYAIAIVDIDHFKNFNDTYGHDVGDQVLCMVAKRLTDVGGDGQPSAAAARSSPSSFATLPPGKPFEHLEALRRIIEKSTFHVRPTRAERVGSAGANKHAGSQKRDRVNKGTSFRSPPAVRRIIYR
jgi:GGDEF domain-containing protein